MDSTIAAVAVGGALGAVLTLACAPPAPVPAAPPACVTSTQRYANKVCVVTGAASGLGLATCERMLRDGAAGVLMTDVNKAALNEQVERLSKISGAASVKGVVRDISTRDGAEGVMAAAEKAWGHVDVLVNSAGITARNVRADADFEERWDAVMKVNVKGTMLMCHAAVDAFRRRSANGFPSDSAAIVNLGSINVSTANFC